MSKVKIRGNASGTGIFTVAAPATNTDRTITLPDTSSTVFTEAGGTIQAPVSINSDIDESSTYSAQLTLNSNNKATGQYARLLFQHSDHGSASIASDYESSGYGNLIFSTRNGGNPSEKMRIDSGGRVTMPYQPVFSVTRTDGDIATSSVHIGNLVLVNVGGHYNTSNGRFTAPVTGVYAFHCYFMAAGSSNETAIAGQFFKNGTALNNSVPYTRANGENFAGMAGHVIISLNVNDYVELRNQGSNNWYGTGTGHNAFSGHLIG